MTSKVINGSCLCGSVGYQISGNQGIFQYCHCSRCRKISGSAHSANLFVSPEDFQWTKGEELVGRYEPEAARHFASCFCKQCGSSLPWLTKSQKSVVIPAGTLNDDPEIRPAQSIFWASHAPWYLEVKDLPKHDELPPRKK